MSRRIVRMLVFLAVLLLFGSAGADRISSRFRYDLTENGEAVITRLADSGHFQDSSLAIPAEIDGLPVVGIRGYAFARLSVTSVSFPDSLRFISAHAFTACGSLTEVRFGSGLQQIGEGAFEMCESLSSLQFPDTLEYIGPGAFRQCALHEVALPASLREIGEDAFLGNDFSGFDLVLPEELSAIGSRAFQEVASVTVPASLQVFPSDFISMPGRIILAQDHPALRLEDGMWLISRTEGEERLILLLDPPDEYEEAVLAIPETVTVVSDGALRVPWDGRYAVPASLASFEGDGPPFSGAKSITVAEGNPRYRMENGFLIDTESAALLCWACEEVPERLVLPDGIRAVSEYVFSSRCPAEIVVPEGVEYIGEGAFSSPDLRKLSLPSTVSACGGDILNSRSGGVSVDVAPGAWNLRFYSRYGISPDGDIPAPLLLKKSGKSTCLYFLYTDGSCCVADFLDDRENIGSVQVPEKLDGHMVRGIGPGAFSSIGAKSISLPRTVEFVGDEAFTYTTIESFSLQSPLLHCGREPFLRCGRLELPEEKAAKWNIDRGPLWEYTLREDGSAEITGWRGSGKKAVVPAEIDGHPVRSITGRVDDMLGMVSPFFSGPVLREIVLPEGLETIGAYAFAKVSSDVKPVRIPSTVTEIGPYAFCSNGASRLEIPDSVTKLGIGCFSFCHNLKTARLGRGVSSLPADAFYYCYCLTSVSFSGSVEEIGAMAFCHTDKLTSFTWPKGLKRIGFRAFANCPQKSVVLPEGLEEIGTECYAVDDKHVDGLTSVVIPGSLRVIPEYAFAGNTSLKKAVFRNGVEEIGAHAFDSCALASLDLPDSMRVIGDSAFAWNRNLKTLKLKEGLETMADGCFKAHALSGVTLPASLKSVGKEALVPNKTKGSFTITVLGMETELHENAFCIEDWCKDTMKIACLEGSRADLLLQSGAVPADKIKVSYLK